MKTQTNDTIKAPKLLVDNLRHISDHGFAVQFAEPKLAAMVARGLANPAGNTTLRAGESEVKITKLGNVTRTCAFFSVGSRRKNTIHYYDPIVGIKFSVCEQDGQAQSHAFWTLVSIIFGDGPLPSIWMGTSGAAKDELQTWLGRWAWTLTGVSGLRAQALTQHSAAYHSAITSAENGLRYQTSLRERLELQTPETFRERHESARGDAIHQLERVDQELALCAEHETELTKEETGNPAVMQAIKDIGAHYGARNIWLDRYTRQEFGWQAVKDTMHPSQVAANYAATVEANGTISLSSGLVCEFTLSQLTAWLRGETPAPKTRYGVVSKLETCDETGKPVVLLKCGCHSVDAASVSPEIAALLVPTHTVTIQKGAAAAYFGTPGFLPRLRHEIANKQAELTERRAQTLRDALENRHNLTNEENNLPAKIAEQNERVAAAQADLDKSKLDLARYVRPIGAEFDDLQSNICRAVSALNFIVTLNRE